MKPKGQMGFAIVNIIFGVIFTLSGIMMFKEPNAAIVGVIEVPIGLGFFIIGSKALKCLKNYNAGDKKSNTILKINMILFIISCVVLVLLLIFIAYTMRKL